MAGEVAAGVVGGLIGGVFTATVLVAFGDTLRDWSIRIRTLAPPGHVLMLYDPREPAGSGPTARYNLFGVRENDSFDGIFGLRNPDGSTNFDISFRYKGFSRDGQLYFTYAPNRPERYGSGQFQSVNRWKSDLYYGLALGWTCDTDKNVPAVQRALVGVVARVDQTREADEAAAFMLPKPAPERTAILMLGNIFEAVGLLFGRQNPTGQAADLAPLFSLDLAVRDCVGASPIKKPL